MATTMNCSVNVKMNKIQVDFGKERMIVVGRQDSFFIHVCVYIYSEICVFLDVCT